MNENLQETAWSVDLENAKHQPAGTHLVGGVRSYERESAVNGRGGARRRGQRAPQARQGLLTELDVRQCPTSHRRQLRWWRTSRRQGSEQSFRDVGDLAHGIDERIGRQ